MTATEDLRTRIAALRARQWIAYCAPEQLEALQRAAVGLMHVRFVPAASIRAGTVLVYDRADLDPRPVTS